MTGVQTCALPILKAEKEFSDAVLEGIPGYLYVYDEENRLVKWNKKHETLTGYTYEELSRKKLSDWFDQADLEQVTRTVTTILETGYGEVEADLLTKDGARLRVFFNGVRLNMGGKTYFTGVGLDVTERRIAEQRITEQLDELRRWHSVTLGREGRILQLKVEVNKLLEELGRPLRYPSAQGLELKEVGGE